MKKSIGILVCAALTTMGSMAYADDNASLKIHVANTSKDNTYFLCTDGVGCVSMFAADHGKSYPLTPGQIERIYMVNLVNLRTYFQPLPASCNVTVNANQTLVIKGKVVKDPNNKAHIAGLECSVV